jgi:hypothetical protein
MFVKTKEKDTENKPRRKDPTFKLNLPWLILNHFYLFIASTGV